MTDALDTGTRIFGSDKQRKQKATRTDLLYEIDSRGFLISDVR